VRVSVRLGAGLSNVAGRPRLQMEVPEGTTVGDVLRRVGEEHPSLGDGLDAALTVVDGSQADAGRPLAEGEEIALLLPVAGGAPDAPFELQRRTHGRSAS